MGQRKFGSSNCCERGLLLKNSILPPRNNIFLYIHKPNSDNISHHSCPAHQSASPVQYSRTLHNLNSFKGYLFSFSIIQKTSDPTDCGIGNNWINYKILIKYKI